MTSVTRDRSWKWYAGAVLVVVAAGLGLRIATSALVTDAIRDEPFIRVPIENLVRHGWSVETANDLGISRGRNLA